MLQIISAAEEREREMTTSWDGVTNERRRRRRRLAPRRPFSHRRHEFPRFFSFPLLKGDDASWSVVAVPRQPIVTNEAPKCMS